MPGTRSPLQREKDLARTEELQLRGYNAVEIAGEMGVSAEQIRRDLKRISQTYVNSQLRNFELDLNRQLRKIDLLERSAWQFLGNSEQDRLISTRRQRTRTGDDGEQTVREASTRTEQRDPDSRYMTVIQWCIAERNRLLNLYPAEEVRHSGAVSVTEIVYELSPQQPSSGMTIIGGRDLPPGLVDGQVEVIGGGRPQLNDDETPSPEELWGVEPEPVEVET